MKSLLLVLLLGSVGVAQIDKPKVIEVKECFRVPTEKPDSTGLQCGSDEKGPLILDIPETLYQFPEGEVFHLYIYSNGHQEFPEKNQPKGSVVKKTPPCEGAKTEFKKPLSAPLCNPELTPQ